VNLKRVIFWRPPVASDSKQASRHDAPMAPPNPAEPQTAFRETELGHMAQVIPLPAGTALSNPQGTPPGERFADSPPPQARIQGLLNTPELEAFFKTNQFGFGRHHGTRYRSLEALDRGLDAVVAEFQHIVAGLAERRQAKVDRLQLVSQEVATLSDAMAGQVNLALAQTQRELAALREQAQLAEQRKGWVLDALNRYRLGFDRGVRDALDFELLGS
jgi:hypothetical protein